MDSEVAQMRKGLLEYCVMALLAARPHYGYELVQELGRVDGLLTSEGTMYPLLARLRRERVVETEWRESSGGPPRKYYRLSPAGERALVDFRKEWATLRSAVDGLLKGGAR
ncbi:MAG TPA: PadR family transcriptional regulator [Candidatus Dormibacteraeota bacterium]